MGRALFVGMEIPDRIRKLSRVVEQTDDLVMITQPDGTIEYVNPSFEKQTGFTCAEVVGKTPRILKSGKQDPAVYENLWKTILAGQPYHGVLINRRKSGELFYTQKTITPLKSADGKIESFVSTDKDITMEREAELNLELVTQELKRSNAELEQFAGMVSHDLQEPLRTIASHLQLLEKKLEGKLTLEQRESLEFAVDAARRMKQTIVEVLAYSRLNRNIPTFTTFNAKEPVDFALNALQTLIRETGAKIEIGPLPKVTGDRNSLGILFQNLLGNSIKYRAKATPRVKISAVSDPAGQWLFCVEDNGIGFDPKFQQRIFQIFQRLHTQAEVSGSGIGLAACKRIVELHGGKIWADSTPGQGSRFYFTIPDHACV